MTATGSGATKLQAVLARAARRKVWLSLLLALLAILIWYFSVSGLSKSDSLPGRRAEVELAGEKFELEVADSDALRGRGLSGRSSIPREGGMLFLFPNAGQHAFWMKDMRFAIDIIWLRGDKIVFVQRNAMPPAAGTASDIPRYIPSEEADKVIEVRAGTAERLGLESGQRVKILLP